MIPLATLLLAPFTVYASPQGDDAAAGTVRAPVRSLARAVVLVRKGREGRSARIVLAPGDYPLSETLDLGGEDRDLRIEGGGGARLLGGKSVRGGRPVTDPAILKRLAPPARTAVREIGLAEAGLDAGRLRLRGFVDGSAISALELFAGGKPMQVAKYPNGDRWLLTSAKVDDRTFAYADDRPKGWATPNDAWAFGYFRFEWADTYDRIEKLDPEAGTATLERAPEFGIDAKRRFTFFNVLEELDEPGEYFVDRRNGKLYFWPPAKGGGELLASLLEGPLVRMRGASGITLSGLQLEPGRDGGVRVEGGERDRIENCLLRNLGTYGVSIRGAKDSGVAGCDLTGLGSRGIELIGGDRQTLTPANLYAKDNHIWAYSRWPRTYQAGVTIEGVGATVANNLIEDAPHNAILLSGNDHRIEGNDVRNVCLETGDSGAVYMGRNLTMRGNRIRGNRFRGIVPKVNAEGTITQVISVYLDDQWCGTEISGNVFEGPGTGILIGGGRDNTVAGNVFVDKDPAFHFDQRGKGWASDKAEEFRSQVAQVHADGPLYTARYPRLKGMLDSDFMRATGNAFVGNVVAGKRPFWFQDGLSEKSLDYRDNVLLPNATLKEALAKRPAGSDPIRIERIGLLTKRRPLDRVR